MYVETAQALARRVVQTGGDLDRQIDFAFRCVLVRPPSEKEAARLKDLFHSELNHFKENVEEAKALATKPLGPVESEDQLPELAAWTAVGECASQSGRDGNAVVVTRSKRSPRTKPPRESSSRGGL